ncbi:MAG: helix-turn-helix domain-containing protein [Myxococcales bacterium]
MRHPDEYVDEDAPTGIFVRRTSPGPARTSKHRGASDMLTVKEAADLLRVNVKTIYAELASGRLPHVMLGRRIIRIPRAVLASLASKSA